MKNVELTIENNIANVQLANGVTNAISPSLVGDVQNAVDLVKKEARGMILTGGEKFFSIGFDVPSLLLLDRDDFADFFTRFNQVILDIFTLPMPTASAIEGHATGGGNVFVLPTDYRFMEGGKKLIGLNEVNLGVPIPYLTDLILMQVTGGRTTRDMVFSGDLYSSEQAEKMGLVDEVTPGGETVAKAMEKVSALARKPSAGFAAIKKNRVEQIQGLYEKNGPEKNRQFVDCWFLDDVQTLIKKAAEKF